jgi:hypothetical protein
MKRVMAILLIALFCIGMLGLIGCDPSKQTAEDAPTTPEQVKSNMAKGGMTQAGEGPAGKADEGTE